MQYNLLTITDLHREPATLECETNGVETLV